MGNEILTTLHAALRNFGASLALFLPRLLVALAILVLGWVLAAGLRLVTRAILRWIRFDQLVERVGAGTLVQKVFGANPHVVVAKTLYWLTWIAVLLAAMQALGLSGTAVLFSDFVRFLPRLGSAIVVLVLGLLLSSLAWRASLLAAVTAGMHAAKLLGTLVRWLVVVATVAAALEQIDVGRGVVHTAFAIVLGAVMLAGAIAFGLGGRHVAKRFIEERLLARDRPRDQDEASHM